VRPPLFMGFDSPPPYYESSRIPKTFPFLEDYPNSNDSPKLDPKRLSIFLSGKFLALGSKSQI